MQQRVRQAVVILTDLFAAPPAIWQQLIDHEGKSHE